MMAGLTLAGAGAASIVAGWQASLGFATGAVFSIVNFWFWHRVVRRVGDAPARNTGKAPAVGFVLRYFLFAAGLYATIRYFEASLSAALAGIFVAVAAVLFEALIELIYGT
jgi:hypothetical protein